MMKKEEIIEKIGEELAEKIEIVERKSRIDIPFHRLGNWGEYREALKAIGFSEARAAFFIFYEKEAAEPLPSIREKYEEMSQEDQMKADQSWLRMGGHLSEEKMARLEAR